MELIILGKKYESIFENNCKQEIMRLIFIIKSINRKILWIDGQISLL